ncbi:MAG: hypothetical protein ACP5N2_04555 [Candidatus Nanoarchaeia archaeon]
MLEENEGNIDKTYNFHLLAGHFIMLDEVKEDDALKEIDLATLLLLESKTKKGVDKILTLAKTLISYAKALTLYDKCEITDEEGLLCFLCTRYPDLELDWTKLQKILLALKNNNVDYQDQKTLELVIIIYNSAIVEKINHLNLEDK